MKINDVQRVGGVNPYRKDMGKPGGGIAKSGKARDEVSISPEAMEMLHAQASEDVSRTERVQELKQAVSSGTYQVDAGKIAEKLYPYLANGNE